jgi:hypothetical protein
MDAVSQEGEGRRITRTGGRVVSAGALDDFGSASCGVSGRHGEDWQVAQAEYPVCDRAWAVMSVVATGRDRDEGLASRGRARDFLRCRPVADLGADRFS